ncbi:MAG: hypothetical protein IJQ23_01780, partial [Clostridia bacterium]|nr:hypothetical protein [Clostridia bacterium]
AYSFLDFAEPLNDPVIDCGRWHTTVELRGNILVTQLEGGVLIGNEVETKIRVDIGKQTEMEGVIEVISSDTTITKTQEAPQMANKDTAESFNNTQAYTYAYTILLMKNAICKRLFKAAKNIEPFAVNEKIQITETYPPFIAGDSEFIDTKNLILTSATLSRKAGAFVTIDLSFQDRLRIETLDSDNITEEDEERTIDFVGTSSGTNSRAAAILAYNFTSNSSGGSGGGSGGGVSF